MERQAPFNMTPVERVGAVFAGLTVAIVLRESVFDDAGGDVSLLGNVAVLAIACALTMSIVALVWALRRAR